MSHIELMVSTVNILLDEKMNAGYLIKIESNYLLIDCVVLNLHPFYARGLFFQSLQTWENLCFFDALRVIERDQLHEMG